MSNEPKTLLINLISSEPANVGKAVRMGRKFLADQWLVVLSMNLEAVKLLEPAFGEAICPVAGTPLTGMLKAFQADGGRVLVGKECMVLAGLDESQFLPGMETATFPVLAEILGRVDARTMTW